MRALVAVTCVAVLAAVGYYFWSEYSEAQKIARLQEMKNAAEKANLERLSSEDYKKCRNSLYSSALGEAKKLRDWCRDNGFITYREQLDAEAGRAPN